MNLYTKGSPGCKVVPDLLSMLRLFIVRWGICLHATNLQKYEEDVKAGIEF